MPRPYKNPVCRGSYLLGSACGTCEKCVEQQAQLGLGEKFETVATGHFKDGVMVVEAVKADKPVEGLPVSGYRKEMPQSAIDLVNQNKALEELVMRQIDRHVRNRDSADIDQRQVALARTKLEEAFYHLNKGVFQPTGSRIDGPLDLSFLSKLSS